MYFHQSLLIDFILVKESCYLTWPY